MTRLRWADWGLDGTIVLWDVATILTCGAAIETHVTSRQIVAPNRRALGRWSVPARPMSPLCAEGDRVCEPRLEADLSPLLTEGNILLFD